MKLVKNIGNGISETAFRWISERKEKSREGEREKELFYFIVNYCFLSAFDVCLRFDL